MNKKSNVINKETKDAFILATHSAKICRICGCTEEDMIKDGFAFLCKDCFIKQDTDLVLREIENIISLSSINIQKTPYGYSGYIVIFRDGKNKTRYYKGRSLIELLNNIATRKNISEDLSKKEIKLHE